LFRVRNFQLFIHPLFNSFRFLTGYGYPYGGGGYDGYDGYGVGPSNYGPMKTQYGSRGSGPYGGNKFNNCI